MCGGFFKAVYHHFEVSPLRWTIRECIAFCELFFPLSRVRFPPYTKKHLVLTEKNKQMQMSIFQGIAEDIMKKCAQRANKGGGDRDILLHKNRLGELTLEL